jgi:transcriptional regulator with XRE-family HTH domain
MAREAFFTPEMSVRLREFRLGTGLTQDELAGRMGLKGPQRRKQVERLETTRAGSPTLEIVIRYLRACGAHWSDFVELIESFSPPAPPMKQAVQDSARFQNYRVVREAVEQAVAEELRQTDLMPPSYVFYKSVARQALSVLWRETRRTARGKRRKEAKLRLQDKLEAKDAEWRKQRLDMALVTRVRDIVVDEFTRLVRLRPELFYTP